jgi:N-acetylglucosamine kinase-like BadF-type ATPase
METLLAWFYGLTHPRSHLARLAQTVDGLAEQNNPIAVLLMHQAADELVLLAQTALKLLDNPAANRFSFAGSVFKSRTVREMVKEQLTSLGSWQTPVLAPIGGALLHAAQQAGWNPGTKWIANLQPTLVL